MKTLELTKQEEHALYEACTAYTKAIKKLKMKGVTNPERALKEFVADLEANIETINESVDIIMESEQFSDYFNVGSKAGMSIEEIQEAFEAKDSEFLKESSFYNGVSTKINSLKSMGHKVHNVSVTSRGGIPHAEFISTDKDNNKKRHVIHGNSSTVSNLGKIQANDPDSRDEGI